MKNSLDKYLLVYSEYQEKARMLFIMLHNL